MKHCNKWNQLFDTPHNERRVQEILNHTEYCHECRAQAAQWMKLEKGLQSALESIDVPEPTRTDAAHLLMRLENQKSSWTSGSFGFRLALAGATMVLLLGLVSLFWGNNGPWGQEPDAPSSVMATIYSADDATPVVREFDVNESLTAPQGGHLLAQLGDDSFAIAGSGTVQVVQKDRKTTRLRLKRGQIACQVAPRQKGAQFVVEANGFKVKVIGTRFSVLRGETGGLEVSVQEGLVEVSNGKQQWMVRSAQSLRLNQDQEANGAIEGLNDEQDKVLDKLLGGFSEKKGLVPEEPPRLEDTTNERLESETDEGDSEPSPDVDETEPHRRRRFDQGSGDSIEALKALVADGQLPEAEKRLHTYLRFHRNDPEALLLLADSQRKSQKWKQAVATYLKVVDSPHSQRANRARFLAGTIYQANLGQHNQAIQMFDAYLRATSGGDLLRSEAQYRLARSLIATGQTGRAQKVLRDIIANQQGTDLGANAQKLLNKSMEQ